MDLDSCSMNYNKNSYLTGVIWSPEFATVVINFKITSSNVKNRTKLFRENYLQIGSLYDAFETTLLKSDFMFRLAWTYPWQHHHCLCTIFHYVLCHCWDSKSTVLVRFQVVPLTLSRASFWQKKSKSHFWTILLRSKWWHLTDEQSIYILG